MRISEKNVMGIYLKRISLFVFSATALGSSFAHARGVFVDANCLRKILVAHVGSKPKVDHPIAVVDIGSNTLKLAVQSVDGEVSHFMYKVDLGNSLARAGAVDKAAFADLQVALRRADLQLAELGIAPESVEYFATAGIRDAKNSKGVVERLKLEGYRVKVLSEEEEAALVYYSVMRKHSMPPEGAAMLEVGGGSTEIVQGKNLVEIEMKNSRVIHYGSGSLGIKDPFDRSQLLLARKKIKDELLKEAAPLISKDRELLVSSSTIFKHFRKIHQDIKGKDIFKTGILDEDIEFYLSKEGLTELKKIHDAMPIDGDRGLVANLPSKLLMAQEVKQHYGFKKIIFGASGGMKTALIDEVLAKKTYREFKDAAIRFRKAMVRGSERMSERFTALFPEEQFGVWSFRVKNTNSVNSKLVEAYTHKNFPASELKSFSAIQNQVRDGMGGRLILEKATSKERNLVFEKLAQGIKEKKIVLTEIENYRGKDGFPYLSDEQVLALQKLNEDVSGIRPKIAIGAEAEKASGYTTLQINTVDSAGRIGEIQIRGENVQQMFEFDHLIWDIRRKKPVPLWARDIERDFHSLSLDEQRQYLEYLRDYYNHMRMTELGAVGNPPYFPERLPESLKPEF